MADSAPVFAACWAALHRLIDAEAFPVAPVPAAAVKVAYSTWGQSGEPVEGVLVRTITSGNDDDWASLGDQPTARDQSYQTVVEVGTSLPGRTPEQAAERLAALVGVVYSVVRRTARPPHPVEFRDPITGDDRFLWWAVELTDAIVGVLPTNTHGGYARLVVTTRARI